MFSGVSRVAETASLPGDPDNSSRDDQVFPGGSMHISLAVDFPAVSAALIRLPASEAEGQPVTLTATTATTATVSALTQP